MQRNLLRAQLLMDQSRHAEAADELRHALAADPNNPNLHALLAICLVRGEQFDQATQEALQAIHLAPDLPLAHYAHALVLFKRNHYPEAEAAIRQAIELDPQEPDYAGLLAAIAMNRRQWQAALDAAERGLAIDPEHAQCTNLRAMALVKLGRREQAGLTIDAALAKDPENALTHANQGWALLERREPAKAMQHFREALRLDPQLDWARQGIVEALKAHNIVYRLMLGYFLWMAKLSHRVQWMIIVGAWFLNQFLRQLERQNPEWSPFLGPLLVLYLIFAVMTWVADPLFNLLLRLNRFGRLALSRDQIVASNWFGLCIALALASLVAWAFGNQDAKISALVFGLLVVPLAGTFHCDQGWPRTAMGAVAAALALLGCIAASPVVLRPLLSEPAFELVDAASVLALLGFVVGVFASQFIANALASVTPRR